MRIPASLLALACSAPVEPPAPPPFPGPFLGQWVWTQQDLAPLDEARGARAVVAGVHIASVRLRDGEYRNELGTSPRITAAPVAWVVRIEDEMHAAWDRSSDDEIADGLGGALERVLRMAADKAPTDELQLDYDAPVRHLPRWAAVLKRLRPRLAVRHLWITSLVAHVSEPRYGEWMAGAVDGHILQVFDTGDDPGSASSIREKAERAQIPFRLGLGAFERKGTPVEHRAWFARAGEVCRAPACDGVWVFPAGNRWYGLTTRVTNAPP